MPSSPEEPLCRHGEADLSPFFDGHCIYGDDFSDEEVRRWFDDEAEAYADLGAKDSAVYRYQYHAMNQVHGFDRLPPDRRFEHVLGFGSAYGDELLPIIDRIGRVTIVDPSDSFVQASLKGKQVTRLKPDPSGELPFREAQYDLITCFGVLHHIPNVSRIIAEFSRVARPGGTVLVREPIVSMGDWRRRRPGLTSRERGIPLEPLRDAFRATGLREISMRLTGFAPLLWILGRLGINPYNTRLATRVDSMLAGAFRRNYRYHAQECGLWGNLRPTTAFFVLQRPQ